MLTGRLRGLALVVVVALCAPLTAQKSQLGYYRQPAIWNDTIVFTAEGDLWRVGVGGRGRAAADDAPGGGEPAGHLARRQDGGVRGHLRGPGRGLHAAARGRRARPVRPGTPAAPAWLSLDAEGRGALRDPPPLDAAEPATGPPRPGPAHARTIVRSPRPATARSTRRAPRCSSRASPFQGSHTRRYKGGTAQNLWRFDGAGTEATPLTADYAGHQQDADAVEGPRLLRVSDRDGVDEPLVDGRARRRPEAAHEAPRLRRPVAVALERPDRLPARRRHPRLRHRQRARTGPCRSRSCRTSTSCASAG